MGDARQCGVVVQGNIIIGESNGACTTDSGRRAVWRRWPAHVACIATRGVVAQGDCTCDVLTAMTLATPPRTSACIIDLCAGLGILLHSRSCLGLFIGILCMHTEYSVRHTGMVVGKAALSRLQRHKFTALDHRREDRCPVPCLKLDKNHILRTYIHQCLLILPECFFTSIHA